MISEDSRGSASRLMGELRGGSPEAAGKLVELFYPELRRLATTRMLGENSNHTRQATVLVNELYLELTRIKALPPGSGSGDEIERDEFFGLAAFLMKRLLARHARPLRKRMEKNFGGNEIRDVAVTGEQSLREIENLLDRLGGIDPKLRAVTEMKVFEGLSREEIALRLGCSVRTVTRYWYFIQEWLRGAMSVPNEGA